MAMEKRRLSLEDDVNSSSSMSVSASAHLASTIALCMCTLTHSYLLISVFPYSGFMAIDLLPAANEENVGSYAGLIASFFMIGRAFSSYAWGKWADIYGRTTVLYASLILSSIFTLFFGMATSFGAALFFRFLLGIANGITGTAKTAVSELAGGDSALETRGMGMIMAMWGWGFLLSPALSGALAEPVRQYPNAAWVQRFEGILSKYPFLLPNIVGVAFCMVSVIAVKLWVHETLPQDKRRSPKYIFRDCITGWISLYRKILCRNETLPDELQPIKEVQITAYRPSISKDDTEEQDSIQEIRLQHNESCVMLSTSSPRPSIQESSPRQSVTSRRRSSATVEATMASIWAQPDTRRHLIVYWVYSFVAICVDEAFPLFCISKVAGLGISEGAIGKILSGSGLIFAVCQYFVYTFIVDRFGLYGSITIGSFVTVPAIALIPVSLRLNAGSEDGQVTWLTYCYLSVVMALYRIFAIVFFSSISIATNRTVATSHRASMNGMSMLGGSICKGLGPTFAGILVAFFVSSGVVAPRVGAVFVFVVISSLALIVAIPSATILRQESDWSSDNGEDDESV